MSKRNTCVGLTIDTAHLVKSGINDINDGEFRVLGNGQIDFAPVFAAVREIGYDGWMSADEESGADVIPAMGQCFQFLSEGIV